LQLKFFNDQIGQDQAEKGLVNTGMTDMNNALRGQTAQFGKAVLQAAASGVAVYVGGPAGVAAAAAMTYAANTIQVDPATGKTVIKSSDQAVINTAITTTAMALSTAGIFGQSAVIGSDLGKALVAGGSSLLQSSVQYDAKGSYTGIALRGQEGTAAVIRAGMAFGTSYLQSKLQSSFREAAINANIPETNAAQLFKNDSLLGFAMNHSSSDFGAGLMAEYGIRQTLGKQYSGWDNASVGGYLGGLIGSDISSDLTQSKMSRLEKERLADPKTIEASLEEVERLRKEGKTNEEIVQELRRKNLVTAEAQKEVIEDEYDNAARNGRTHELANILRALGYRKEEQDKIVGGAKKSHDESERLKEFRQAYLTGKTDRANQLLREMEQNGQDTTPARNYMAYIRREWLKDQAALKEQDEQPIEKPQQQGGGKDWRIIRDGFLGLFQKFDQNVYDTGAHKYLRGKYDADGRLQDLDIKWTGTYERAKDSYSEYESDFNQQLTTIKNAAVQHYYDTRQMVGEVYQQIKNTDWRMPTQQQIRDRLQEWGNWARDRFGQGGPPTIPIGPLNMPDMGPPGP
ncbi:MAG: hypothetical protein KDK34_00345, partial [Leptospiraceae bacterium]|nr:hypothetical protein [Leptospiraceae bacterium]